MNNKKKIIGIIVLLILIIAVTVTIIIIKNNANKKMKNYEIEEISEKEYKYFILYANGKYGVMDTSGNIVIDTKYDKVVIPNSKKAVFICSNEGDEKNKVFNEKSEEIFTVYDNVEEIELDGLVTSLPYEKNVLKYKVNDQYGLIDLDGNRIIKATYEEIRGLKYKEGELLAKLNGKYGVINIKGAKLINFDYDDIEADKYFEEEEKYKKSGYIVCKTTNEGYRYGYISNNGEKLLDTNYNNVKRVIDIHGQDIYIIASSNGQYGLIKNKETLIDFKYQGIEYNDTNNLLIINRGAKYGVYTLTGEEIVPIDYKTLQFNGIYIYAKTGSDIKYFTAKGEEVTTKFTSLVPINNGEYYISIDQNGLYGIVDRQQNILIENKFVYIEHMFNNYFSAYKNEKGLGLIDTKGREFTEFNYTTITKIADTELIKAENMENSKIEMYTKDLNQIAKLENAELEIRDTYVRLYNESTNIFIDKQGNIINEQQAKEATQEAPDTIGKYTKDYMGYAQVYYTDEVIEAED